MDGVGHSARSVEIHCAALLMTHFAVAAGAIAKA
jgi:hypothetical protein